MRIHENFRLLIIHYLGNFDKICWQETYEFRVCVCVCVCVCVFDL